MKNKVDPGVLLVDPSVKEQHKDTLKSQEMGLWKGSYLHQAGLG